jgi:hypothetical protein
MYWNIQRKTQKKRKEKLVIKAEQNLPGTEEGGGEKVGEECRGEK